MAANTEYINTTEYKKLENKIQDLSSVMAETNTRQQVARKLRYTEVDIEAERAKGNLMPDELYIPQHIIDTNIRREQSAYVQYITQPQRSVCLVSKGTPVVDTSSLEQDLTLRLRYQGWQLPQFANIDGFQQNGYGVMEVVYDESLPGHLGTESVQMGDFGLVADTRDNQDSELVGRDYYYSRTELVDMRDDPDSDWDATQLDKLIEGTPNPNENDTSFEARDKSLYKVTKVMFRVKGTVNAAWCCPRVCDDWLRAPKPVFIGRRSEPDTSVAGKIKSMMNGGLPTTTKVYETNYPYILFPYLISENNTIAQLKGRAYLDQDCQEATSSLLSSFVTAHRRAAGLYFSKDSDDPNADIALQKNVYFSQGSLINSKIRQFQLTAPDAEVMQAIQTLIASNQNETSQVNFAVNNRKDSRKTAAEVNTSAQQQTALSTVQVVLFANALTEMYDLEFTIIRSRVIAGLIKDVDPSVAQLYMGNYTVRPAGDEDVIERQQMIQMMQAAWPVIQTTAAAPLFMCDMLQKMFPGMATKYIQAIQQAAAQQQQQAASQQVQMAQQGSQGIIHLSQHPEYFSETGRVNAYPAVQQAAQQIEQMQKPQQQAQR